MPRTRSATAAKASVTHGPASDNGGRPREGLGATQPVAFPLSGLSGVLPLTVHAPPMSVSDSTNDRCLQHEPHPLHTPAKAVPPGRKEGSLWARTHPERQHADPSETRSVFLSPKILPALVLRPTAQEFVDPLKYIASIRQQGEETGIVKIIPPENWTPEFALDPEPVSSMDGYSRAVQNYTDALLQFHRQNGTEIRKMPVVAGYTLNLYKLKREVEKRGGLRGTDASRGWSDITRSMGIAPHPLRGLGGYPFSVKQAYLRIILPYETYLQRIAKKSAPTSATRKGPASTRNSSTSSLSIQANSTNSHSGNEAGKEDLDSLEDETDLFENTPCSICGSSSENKSTIIQCDGCRKGFHVSCVLMKRRPKVNQDWFCRDCLTGNGGDFGFEDGEMYTLTQWRDKCHQFKQSYFSELRQKEGKPDNPLFINEHEVEKKFWKTIQTPYEGVEVEYGADLHTSVHGSGFPTVETDPLSPYSTCGWNLNNIPILPGSLLSHIRGDISGCTVPWLYVGMLFSTFCWHIEDHNLYSINYMHTGETKTWYGVPSSHANEFETAMRHLLPELFELSPDLLFHITTIISPEKLVDQGVKVYACDQRAGEFVVTFPRSYHAGFNHGFNVNEAVNFASPDWLPFGRKSIENYQMYRRNPVFSHDQLVLEAASVAKSDAITNNHILPELELLVEREHTWRREVRSVIGKEVLESCDLPEEQSQCAVCRAFAHCSAVMCSSCGQLACLEHSQTVCECSVNSKILRLRYSDEELQQRLEAVRQICCQSVAWRQNYKKSMLENAQPSLKLIKTLINQGAKTPGITKEELLPLRAYLDRCNAWLLDARSLLSRRTRRELYHSDSLIQILGEMIKKGNQLYFENFEIDRLRQWLDDLQDYQTRLRSLLLRPRIVTLEQWNGIKNLAGTLFVELDEAEEVEDWINFRRRYQSFEKILSSHKPMDYDEVIEMLGYLRDYGIHSNDPVNVKLKALKVDAEQWRVDAIGLLKMKRITEEELNSFVQRASKDCAQIPDIYDRVVALSKKTQSWRNAAQKLLATSGCNDTGGSIDALTVDDVIRMINDSQHLPADESAESTPQPHGSLIERLENLLIDIDGHPVKPIEVAPLKAELNRVQKWLHAAKKMFVNRNTPKSLSLSILDAYLRTSDCTRFVDSQESRYCICRSTREDCLMVRCDVCEVWYHGPCVRFTKKVAKSRKYYICAICDPLLPLDRSKRQTLTDLIALRDESKTLKFIPKEVVLISKMIDLLGYFKDRCERVIDLKSVSDIAYHDGKVIAEKNQKDRIATTKNYLRAAEGLPIDVQCDFDTLRMLILIEAPPYDGMEVDTEKLYCVCQQPYQDSIPMIACDECEEWFHMSCVNVDPGDAPAYSNWLCVDCCKPRDAHNCRVKSSVAASSSFNRKRKHEDDHKTWDDESKKSKTAPPQQQN